MEQVAVRGELSRLPVFISFSKPKSKIVAEALRDWLPSVLQAVEPFISESIDKGSAWPEGLDEKLRSARVGIFCLTTENLHQPWIHFEAGALYMSLGLQHVCPYLLDVDYSDVPWPLARFQATKTTKAETRKLLTTINEALGEGKLKDAMLDATFEKWWPDLEKAVQRAMDLKTETKPVRKGPDEILEELLNLTRSQSRQIESLQDVVSEIVASIQQPLVTFAPGVVGATGGIATGGGGAGIGNRSTRTIQSETINLTAVKKVAPDLYAQLARVLTEKGIRLE
jgi:hypothetical protein